MDKKLVIIFLFLAISTALAVGGVYYSTPHLKFSPTVIHQAKHQKPHQQQPTWVPATRWGI